MRVLTLLIPFVLWVGVAKAQLPDFRDLVKDVSPSVVNISTTNAMPETVSDPRLDQMPDIFREFFGNPPGSPRSGPGQRS